MSLGLTQFKYSIGWTGLCNCDDGQCLTRQDNIDYYNALTKCFDYADGKGIDLIFEMSRHEIPTCTSYDAEDFQAQFMVYVESVFPAFLYRYPYAELIIFGNPVEDILNGFLYGELSSPKQPWPPAVTSQTRYDKAINNVISTYKAAYNYIKINYPKTQMTFGMRYDAVLPLTERKQQDYNTQRAYDNQAFKTVFEQVKDKCDFYWIESYEIKSVRENKNHDHDIDTLVENHPDSKFSNYYSVFGDGFDYTVSPFQTGIAISEFINWYADEKPVHAEIALPEVAGSNGEIQKAYLESMFDGVLSNEDIDSVNFKSLIDGFEWDYGYKVKYGLFNVDFSSEKLERSISSAGSIVKNYIQNYDAVDDDDDEQSESKEKFTSKLTPLANSQDSIRHPLPASLIPSQATRNTVKTFSFQNSMERDQFYYEDFEDSFSFGVATASYQIEGAWEEDGKGENIWDNFFHSPAGKLKDSGDYACDSYHKVDEDILMLKQLGVNHYRFSISWPRVMPDGKNPIEGGLDYYKELLRKLHANGITPI